VKALSETLAVGHLRVSRLTNQVDDQQGHKTRKRAFWNRVASIPHGKGICQHLFQEIEASRQRHWVTTACRCRNSSIFVAQHYPTSLKKLNFQTAFHGIVQAVDVEKTS